MKPPPHATALRGRRVVVRVDFNVPLKDGHVADAARLERCLPSLVAMLREGAAVILLSHLGRPGGRRVESLSLSPVASWLNNTLAARGAQGKETVAFAEDASGARAHAMSVKQGGALLLENLRFHEGEEANDDDFAGTLASYGDLYVNNAFSCCHRAHASIEAITRHLPSRPGALLQEEVRALKTTVGDMSPAAALIGGGKVSGKLALLDNLVKKLDVLMVGGAMANTFLAGRGVAVGRSLREESLRRDARRIEESARLHGCRLLLPVDAAFRREGDPTPRNAAVDALPEDGVILDIGPSTIRSFKEAIGECRSLVWNGPLGAFERPPFDRGTTEVARFVAARTQSSHLVSVAGGGDTAAALRRCGVAGKLTYLSLAGGAFLSWLEGRPLPGLEALRRARHEKAGTPPPPAERRKRPPSDAAKDRIRDRI